MVMADEYFDSLENIFDNEKGLRKERARALLDNYRKGSDRKRAKDWETERKSGKMSGGPLINIQNSTVSGSGTIYINAGTSNIDVSKKRYYEKEKDEHHENMKNNHVNEESTVTLEPFVPEEELEENLLQENPGATVDFKLIIDNICIRSEMEKWRRTSKYIEEIHKQDSSGTKARGLFKHQWDDIISNIEKFLVSPYTTLLSSDFDSVSDSDDQDIKWMLVIFDLLLEDKSVRCTNIRPQLICIYFKELPIFASNLWMLRDLITSSINSILMYITSNPLQIDNDNTMIANVEVSPPQKKNYNNYN
ncbi:unnamed protein product [Rhizophagus irregularis]|nr:unnamed protein product [Rhizophagus irregularis]